MADAKIAVAVTLIAAAASKALILLIPNNLKPAIKGTTNVTPATTIDEMITPSTEYMKFMLPAIKLDTTTPPSSAELGIKGRSKIVDRDALAVSCGIDLVDDK